MPYSNAKQVAKKIKPEVKVSTALKGDFVEIKVTDNGTGIPDSVKGKILQPFFTTKPTGEGTGLGLSLSYDIVVKGHGGTMDINSKEGEYTEFTIQIPTSN
jgi:two-component system NtrC family sensor kinase